MRIFVKPLSRTSWSGRNATSVSSPPLVAEAYSFGSQLGISGRQTGCCKNADRQALLLEQTAGGDDRAFGLARSDAAVSAREEANAHD